MQGAVRELMLPAGHWGGFLQIGRGNGLTDDGMSRLCQLLRLHLHLSEQACVQSLHFISFLLSISL